MTKGMIMPKLKEVKGMVRTASRTKNPPTSIRIMRRIILKHLLFAAIEIKLLYFKFRTRKEHIIPEIQLNIITDASADHIKR